MKLRLLPIILGIFVSLMIAAQKTDEVKAATQFSIPTTGVGQSISTHENGEVSAISCDSSNNSLKYVSTFLPEGYPGVQATRQSYEDWFGASCSPYGFTQGTDSKFFIREVALKGSYNDYRIAAYNNGQLRWSNSHIACGSPRDLAYPTVGPNNTTYYIGFPTGNCTTESVLLYAVNSNTGAEKYTVTLSYNGSSLAHAIQHIFPLQSGVAVLDGKVLKFYSVSNNTISLTSQQDAFFASNQSIVSMSVAHNGAGYVLLYPDSDNGGSSTTTCAGETEIGHISASGISLIPSDDCNYQPQSISIAPDGGVITVGGKGSAYANYAYDDRIIKYSSTGTVLYDKDLNQISSIFDTNPPDIKNSHPIVDSDGNAYVTTVAGLLANTNDRRVTYRQLDPSGNATILYTSSAISQASGTQYVQANMPSGSNLYSNHAHILLCTVSSPTASCAISNNLFIVDIENSTIKPAYARSTLKPAQNLTDSDADGLIASEELEWGTYDNSIDSDGDGLSDLRESRKYTGKFDTYCGYDTLTAVYKCTWPDPAKKDVFIEVDWMPSSPYSTKPDTSTLSSLISKYKEDKVNLHIDAGEYGGGNAVEFAGTTSILPEPASPSNNNARSIYEYKLGSTSSSSNFDIDNRYRTWRYTLIADGLLNDRAGLAWAGDDDSLIGTKEIYWAKYPQTINTATYNKQVGKALMHEWGHNLCLSSELQYNFQSGSCISVSVESTAVTESIYPSIMNYNVYENISSDIKYSHGSNGVANGDHDDWAAIDIGINDYACLDTGDATWASSIISTTLPTKNTCNSSGVITSYDN
ncbi:hypothetical protein JNJ66_03880 [Candidatus Saccharibacteria bacterium]|nr:hypothetical protein [Candidatus Saccharibacteria bacterium]